MNELRQLPNIGQKLADKLIRVGIKNADGLRELGSENAFIRIATLERTEICINMLFALEGAVQGIRWHNLPGDLKEHLKSFYKQTVKLSKW